jgi:hypothetical protein
MGYGVAGVCWRGPRIFEGPLSKAIVTNWIAFYNRYRDTLTSDMLIHVRRPDGQNLDAILHANPSSNIAKGLLFAFNPTTVAITANLSIPLYYTGLEETAAVTRGNSSPPIVQPLRRDYSIVVQMVIPASSYAWWVINDGTHKY